MKPMAKQSTGISGTAFIRVSESRSSVRRIQLTVPELIAAAGLSLTGTLFLAGCQSVSGISPTSLLRVIDASYNAPAINVYVEGKVFASNMGQGNITSYGLFGPSNNAAIKVTGTTSTTALVNSNTTLRASTSQSVLISDVNAQYQVTVLQDQATAAPTGHSEFRVLNQAPSTGPIDVYVYR